MNEIRAIETEYKGYRFRSRLEARWAVFFDALGIEYEYEPEGFCLPSGKLYLPDFRIKCYGMRGRCGSHPFDLYVEVKGHMTLDDAIRIEEFAYNSQEGSNECREIENPVLIVGDIPNPDTYEYDCRTFKCYDQMNGIDIYPWNYELIDGDYFGAYPAVHEDGRFYLDGDDWHYQTMDLDMICQALKKAKQARFEHGEKPSTTK